MMNKKRTNIHPKSNTQSIKTIQQEAIVRTTSLFSTIALGPRNLFGMYVMSSKVISAGRAYRKFMKRHYVQDPEIGDMVKTLPHLWFMGIFQFDVFWIVFGIIIIRINILYPSLRSGYVLSGKFEGMDATYFLLFIVWSSLYFFFKMHLSNKSHIFRNLLFEINEILISRENNKR